MSRVGIFESRETVIEREKVDTLAAYLRMLEAGDGKSVTANTVALSLSKIFQSDPTYYATAAKNGLAERFMNLLFRLDINEQTKKVIGRILFSLAKEDAVKEMMLKVPGDLVRHYVRAIFQGDIELERTCLELLIGIELLPKSMLRF